MIQVVGQKTDLYEQRIREQRYFILSVLCQYPHRLYYQSPDMSYYRYITGVYKSYWPELNRTLRSSSVPRTVLSSSIK